MQKFSMSIDTACSAGLVSMDIACRYLNSGEIDGAIVAASNLYLRCVAISTLLFLTHIKCL